ncbi:MAG TPA: hypothetical protein VFP84_22765 [Kofleriaceae bacterium]|nr:hypothetical protein [Kofleriaceae bacterium]
MNELVDASLQFPTVVFTISLGIILVYWAFVLLGALDIDLLGGDADVDMHVDLHGADHAGHAHGAGDGDLDASGDADGGVWHSLGLGDVPLTISISVITLVAWCGSLLAAHYVIGPVTWERVIVLVAALVVALPIAAVLVRPLAPIFRVREGKSNTDYVGHTCVITTGRVDDSFGQATLEDGGTVHAITVRCDRGAVLARGDRALIIDFDAARQAYVVEPAVEG